MTSSKGYTCRNCGHVHPQWAGRCGGCGEWSSLDDRPAGRTGGHYVRAKSLASVDEAQSIPVPTGVDEIDRVLGGGFVPGSVSLLSGEPGIGKSTLTLQLALRVARVGGSVILVTGEESPAQVRARAARIHNRPIPESLGVLDTVDTDNIVEVIGTVEPQMVVVDSVQMLTAADSPASGSAQVLRTVTAQLAEIAKKRNVSLLLIGHVTKDGSLAGPRTLEHMVDTVLSFEGDRNSDLRFLRSVKHRFGPTSEVGLFEMIGTGLRPVADPSSHFLADRRSDRPGSAVVPVLDGRRPVMVEIQALIEAEDSDTPKCGSFGLPSGRAKVVRAVAGQHIPKFCDGADLLVSAAGGARVNDPAADVGLLAAMLSVSTKCPLPPRTAFCGEIGLGGELRRVPSMERRLHEAFRLGFTTVVAPNSAPDGPPGLAVERCCSVESVARYALSATVS